MNAILEKVWFKWLLIGVGIITVLAPIIGSFLMAMDVDSAIILTEMERIYEGYVPYKTMHLQYPPLWFYINVALKWLFHVPYGCFEFYLAIHWLYVIGCAICIYSISLKFMNSNAVALLVVWLFFVVSHWLQGNEILFEIPSIFWGLLAIALAFKWGKKKSYLFVVVGFIACLSFLTKQFGAGFSLLVAWVIIASQNEHKWKQLGYYAIGYIIPVLICFACWGTDIFECILFNGYGTDVMDAYWGRVTTPANKFQRMYEHLFHFCNRIAPVIYGGIVLLPFAIKQGKYREALLCFFAIGGFLLQFWFVHGGSHYYQYLIPFALLLIPICLSLDIIKCLKYAFYVLIVLTAIFSCYSTFRNRVWKIYVNPNYHQKADQLAFGERISNMVEDGKTVYIAHGGLDYLYYTANLYPPCMQKYGYAVGPMEINIEGCAEMVENADYVLRFSKEMMRQIFPNGQDFEYYFTDSIQNIVAQYPSDTLDEKASTIIHYMSLPKIKPLCPNTTTSL